jgi:hypothetical protein
MACGRQPGHGRTPQGGRRAGTGGPRAGIGSSRAGTSGSRAGIGSSRPRAGAGGRQTGIGGLETRTGERRTGISGLRGKAGGRQTGIGRLQTRTGERQTGIDGLQTRTGGPRAGAGRLGVRPGRPRTGAGRWLAGGGRIHARARHRALLRRWPAEPCRTSLPPVRTAGPAIPWLSDPARGRASAGRHGISGWLRRLSRYHGSLRAGRDGGRPARGIIAKLLTTMPGPVTPAPPAHARTAACPTPGPRSRPMLTWCCGVRLNEAGRPAALIMGGSSMLGLLPRSLLFLQRTATDGETPACPAAQSACHAGKRRDRYFDEKFHRTFRWCSGVTFLAAALPESGRSIRIG